MINCSAGTDCCCRSAVTMPVIRPFFCLPSANFLCPRSHHHRPLPRPILDPGLCRRRCPWSVGLRPARPRTTTVPPSRRCRWASGRTGSCWRPRPPSERSSPSSTCAAADRRRRNSSQQSSGLRRNWHVVSAVRPRPVWRPDPYGWNSLAFRYCSG